MKVKDSNPNKKLTQGSVFDELGFSPSETSALKMKAELLDSILTTVAKRRITPRELERVLDQPQPRISELLGGKISTTSIEKLLGYLERLGAVTKVRISFKRRKTARKVA